MPRYTAESRDRVRDAVDFVELVGARTELRRAGQRRWAGLCPFHEERTPSFGIDPVEKLYHCFGCGAGGDVFRFVMETEGLDFAQALESLADRTGVQLEPEAEDPREAARRTRRDRLLALLERTAAYYVRLLWESREAQPAREYLGGRGLGEGILREFRVGWSPEGWDRVLAASRRAGYSEEELLGAGLVLRARDGRRLYDRFRGRLMFPLADPRGRVLGFGARAIREGDRPKYVNSSDGELFHKGRHVYAHDLARAAAAREGVIVLAEGYTDVIALHQAGLRHVVGSMGTALTPDQATRLRQLAPTVALCLDADAAGREAMARAADLLGGRGREVRVVALPAGLDPADVVQRDGAEAMAARLAQAVPLARWEVERILDGAELGNPEGRDRAVDALGPVFAGIPQGNLRQDLVRRVADRLAAPPEFVGTLLDGARSPSQRADAGGRADWAGSAGGAGGAARAPARGAGAVRGGAAAASGSARGDRPWTRSDETERAFLARCLAVPEQGRDVLAEAAAEGLLASELTRRAAAFLGDHFDRPGEERPDDEALAHLIAELVVRAGELPPDAAALEVERLQLRWQRLGRDIQDARRTGAPVAALARERQRVHEEIRLRLV